MGKLAIRNLTIQYGSQPIVENINLEVQNGEFVSVLGESGIGKTSILKVIAGLIKPKSGAIEINNQPVTHIPAEKRDVVMVFQQPLLFPTMTVADNIAFGLKVRKKLADNEKKKVERYIQMVQLDGLEARFPSQLSGGQQQRVALARALITEPAVLLLDEPISSLDSNLRDKMRELIQKIHSLTGATMLFVTHDRSEAMILSDKIALLSNKKINQLGTPEELFYEPKNLSTAKFFGYENFIPGTLSGSIFSTMLGSFIVDANSPKSRESIATIRPEAIEITNNNNNNCLRGIVQEIQFQGISSRLKVSVDKQDIVLTTTRNDITKGECLFLHLPKDKICILADPG